MKELRRNMKEYKGIKRDLRIFLNPKVYTERQSSKATKRFRRSLVRVPPLRVFLDVSKAFDEVRHEGLVYTK